jgi:DNA-binding NarL/FixJ family response regulator
LHAGHHYCLSLMSIRVAIVEDNHALRESLSQLIGGSPGYTLAGDWPNCSGMLSGVKEAKPDVVLMDIQRPGMSGIEGVSRLKQMMPGVEVLMLTVFEDEEKIFDSICAGASGYLLKRTPPAALLEAIQEVKAGGAPMTAKIARRVLHSFQQTDTRRAEQTNLTDREQQVLAGLVKGYTYQVIAGQHHLSIDTIRSHVKSIYRKLQVNSKAEAVAVALRNKLV